MNARNVVRIFVNKGNNKIIKAIIINQEARYEIEIKNKNRCYALT